MHTDRPQSVSAKKTGGTDDLCTDGVCRGSLWGRQRHDHRGSNNVSDGRYHYRRCGDRRKDPSSLPRELADIIQPFLVRARSALLDVLAPQIFDGAHYFLRVAGALLQFFHIKWYPQKPGE